MEKPFLVALNQADRSDILVEEFKEYYPYDKETLFVTSGLEKQGLKPLLNKLKVLCQINGKRFY